MGSLAILARQLGFKVTGCDQQVYPPMSTQLESAGIELIEGFDPQQIHLNPDVFIIGNIVARGNPLMEAILNRGLNYVSGPEWLAREVLHKRWTIGVSGTHGKTTTTSLIAHILTQAGLKPGFLIGGVPQNFSASADLGDSIFFVIEADEYDCAFFDKRSKFVHYRPRTLIINNLEFDHADIFPDLAAIQRQFHHLVRTVPGEGLIIRPAADENIQQMLAQGCWTKQQTIAVNESANKSATANFCAHLHQADGRQFSIMQNEKELAQVNWTMSGRHNVSNALAAIIAAHHAGVPISEAAQALSEFKGVKRRMEMIAQGKGITLYDDFAHHPTAITATLAGLKAQLQAAERILCVIEPRSNTMKLGVHKDQLNHCTKHADKVFWYQPPGIDWDFTYLHQTGSSFVLSGIEDIVQAVAQEARAGDHIVVMSNGGFGGIHQKLARILLS